jgi:hypothetical protein
MPSDAALSFARVPFAAVRTVAPPFTHPSLIREEHRQKRQTRSPTLSTPRGCCRRLVRDGPLDPANQLAVSVEVKRRPRLLPRSLARRGRARELGRRRRGAGSTCPTRRTLRSRRQRNAPNRAAADPPVPSPEHFGGTSRSDTVHQKDQEIIYKLFISRSDRASSISSSPIMESRGRRLPSKMFQVLPAEPP